MKPFYKFVHRKTSQSMWLKYLILGYPPLEVIGTKVSAIKFLLLLWFVGVPTDFTDILRDYFNLWCRWNYSPKENWVNNEA